MSLRLQDRFRISVRELGVSLVLIVGIAIIFAPVWNADFVNLDDFEYVKYNVHLAPGFDWQTVQWAFTPGYAGNWHPLTWLSHLLDYHLFGLNPRWHHIENVCFHGANSVLLFFVLVRLTSRFWESAIAAAVFAWHPLHVESVAWVSERKDVLSTFFGFWCLWFYAKYAQAADSRSRRWLSPHYWLAFGAFVLALMSKPMVVTLPCILLLLDFWPLRRIGGVDATGKMRLNRTTLWPLLREKIPFFVLIVPASVLTVQAQQHALITTDMLPMWARLANAVVSYAIYLRRTIWPVDLSAFYPYSSVPGMWQVVVAALLFGGISLVVVRSVARKPYLVVGWLWFVGALVPVIGIIQVGSQTMADRYMYTPMIGICLAGIWGVSELIVVTVFQRLAFGATALVLLVFVFCSERQATSWRNSISVFNNALLHTSKNYYATVGMANALTHERLWNEADTYFKRAFQIAPGDSRLNYYYGNYWAQQDQFVNALAYFDRALAIDPSYAAAYFDKANSLAMLGRLDEAKTNYLKASELKPEYIIAEVNVAGILAYQKQFNEAVSHYQRALTLDPRYGRAHHLYGILLGRMGRAREAAEHFKLAARYLRQPDATIWNDLAWTLSIVQDPAIHNPREAIRLAKEACTLTQYADPAMLDTLAVAEAEAGEFEEAARMTDKAIELLTRQHRSEVVAEMQRRKQLYLAHQTYRSSEVAGERPVKNLLDRERR